MAVSLHASSQGLELIDSARIAKGWAKADPTWSETAGVALASLKRFWRGLPIRRESFIAICQSAGIDWQRVAELPNAVVELQLAPESSLQEAERLDWRSLSRDMLTAQQRLTTNPLTARDGLTFTLDIYQPIGLQERLQRPKRQGDVTAQQGSQLYQLAPDAGQIFQQSAFFEQVLQRGETPKSRGRRIAIIGEPGSGKTTCLQTIADWAPTQTSDWVVIWIALAELQGKDLQTYILEDWLKAATVDPEAQPALAEKFSQGQVWLLLDGLDEMVTDGVSPLTVLAKQLSGWIAKARIVLTCRLNVWDAGKNALEEFDVYQNLDFSYGDEPASTANPVQDDQVKAFIQRWFASVPSLSEDKRQALGQQLRQELDRPERSLLRDMVKNPLRLALLCWIWSRRQDGKLPETKAALYEQFVTAFYEWKQEQFPTTAQERQALNQALSHLALTAFAQQDNRRGRNIRLSQRLVESSLVVPSNAEQARSYLPLALQIGWLNRVGVAAENPDEAVYAFFHPSFQEYFAVQALRQYGFDFRKDEIRGWFFEVEWDQWIAEWLRPDEQSVSFDIQKSLIQQIEDSEHSQAQEADVRWRMAQALGVIGGNSAIVIQTLTNLLNDTNEYTRAQAAMSLLKVDQGNSEAIEALLQLTKSSDPLVQKMAIDHLLDSKLDSKKDHPWVLRQVLRGWISQLRELGSAPLLWRKKHLNQSVQPSPQADPTPESDLPDTEIDWDSEGWEVNEVPEEEIEWMSSDEWNTALESEEEEDASDRTETLLRLSQLVEEAMQSSQIDQKWHAIDQIKKLIQTSKAFGRQGSVPEDLYDEAFQSVIQEINRKIRKQEPPSNVLPWLEDLLDQRLKHPVNQMLAGMKAYMEAEGFSSVDQTLPGHEEITYGELVHRRQLGESWRNIAAAYPGVMVSQLSCFYESKSKVLQSLSERGTAQGLVL